jgi:hypothetical protein
VDVEVEVCVDVVVVSADVCVVASFRFFAT